MEPILTIVSNDSKQVVMKVRELSNLELAMNPMFTGSMDYLTITRGGTQTLTILHKDRLSTSFSWGSGGTTLVCDNLERLRYYVTDFLIDNLVFINLPHDGIEEARTFFNDNFDKHQLTLKQGRAEQQVWFATEEERQDYLDRLHLKFSHQVPNPYVEFVKHYTL